MSAILANDGILRCQYICAQGEQMSQNGCIYKVASLVGTIDMGMALAQLGLDIGVPLRALLNQNATYRGVTGYYQSPGGTDFLPEYSIVSQGVGGYVSDPLPKQVCGLFTRRTDYRGREDTGRWYVPFPAESANDPTEGRPNSTYSTALSTLGLAVTSRTTVTSGGNSCVLIPGKFVGYVLPPFNFHEWTNYVPRPFWATQRRRGDYGARNVLPF